MRERDFDAWDTLNLRFFRRSDSTAPLPLHVSIISAAGRKDSATVRRLADIALRHGRYTGFLPRELARSLSEAELAGPLGRRMTESDRPRGFRLDGHLMLAEIAAGEGRFGSVRTHLDAAMELDPLRARLLRGAIATLPFARASRNEVLEVERELTQWNAAEAVGTESPSPTSLLFPHMRLYLLGLLRSQLGDSLGALEHAQRLEALAVPGWLVSTRDALARTVRADVAWRGGRPADAVRLLEPVRGQVPLDVLPGGNVPRLGDHILSQEHARFVRADALVQLGQSDEATRWLTHSFVLAPGEFMYRAPVELRLAQIHDRTDRVRAAAHYQRFVSLWQRADAALQPLVTDVRRRLGGSSDELDGKLGREPR